MTTKKELRNSFFVLFTFALIFLAGSCNYDSLGDLGTSTPTNPGGGSKCDTARTISYATDIVPIMVSSCSSNSRSCHKAGNSNGASLDSYSGVGSSVKSGKFLSSIVWDGRASRMPQGSSKLDNCTIAKIKKWISKGYPNN
jgi:hypothetical protein